MVLDRIDECLRMLDAHPHGEGLGLDAHAARIQCLVYIARRVARGQHDGRTLNAFVAAAHARDPPVAQIEARHAAAETDRTARRLDRSADVGDDAGQLVRPDMGMRLVENLLRSAVEDERLQRLVVIAALLAAREELAVGKRPRTAFAESVVRVGIDRAVAVDLRDVALALRNPFAAFEHDRTVAPLDQPQRREQSRRAGTHDHHLGAVAHLRVIEMHGSRLRFAVGIEFEREMHLQLPLPRVDRAFDNPQQRHVPLGDACGTGGQRRIAVHVGGLLGFERKDNGLRHNGQG